MISEEVGAAMGAAYSWKSMCAVLNHWHETFHYRWVRGKIVHPLSIEETAIRKRILEAGYVFLTDIYRREQENGR